MNIKDGIYEFENDMGTNGTQDIDFLSYNKYNIYGVWR